MVPSRDPETPTSTRCYDDHQRIVNQDAAIIARSTLCCSCWSAALEYEGTAAARVVACVRARACVPPRPHARSLVRPRRRVMGRGLRRRELYVQPVLAELQGSIWLQPAIGRFGWHGQGHWRECRHRVRVGG